MFCLTLHERRVLYALAALLALGAVIKKLSLDKYSAVLPRSERVVPAALNINSASQKDLESLPGIGPALAARIIRYRLEQAYFYGFDDLLKVKGVSGKKIAALKGRLSFAR